MEVSAREEKGSGDCYKSAKEGEGQLVPRWL